MNPAGTGLVGGGEDGWRGGRQEAADSVESVREHLLVGEVAGMGDEFAGCLQRPSVCHFGTQLGGEEVAAHAGV